MRKVLFGAAAVLAIAAPAVANAGTQASIDLSYEKSDNDSYEVDNTRLGGTLVHGLGGNMSVQADGATTLQSLEDDTVDLSTGYAAAHLIFDLGSFDVGAFGGIVDSYVLGGTIFGAEGRTSFGNFSVDGSATLIDFDDAFDGNALRVGGAYYFMPNFEVNAGVSQTTLEDGSEVEITELSLGVAYQFSNNIELYGDYHDRDVDYEFGGSEEGDSIRIGIRFNIGGGTLQDNQNSGAFGSTSAISDTFANAGLLFMSP